MSACAFSLLPEPYLSRKDAFMHGVCAMPLSQSTSPPALSSSYMFSMTFLVIGALSKPCVNKRAAVVDCTLKTLML